LPIKQGELESSGKRKGKTMVGWVSFILGLFIVGIAAAKQLGHIYCVPVAVGWYILLLRSSKKKKLDI